MNHSVLASSLLLTTMCMDVPTFSNHHVRWPPHPIMTTLACRELPDATVRFSNIDKEVKNVLHEFKAAKNCIACCNKDGLMKFLEQQQVSGCMEQTLLGRKHEDGPQ